ncbi:hypothetical protein HUT19_15650 [Streptomyces sp. NA02950]|uniref:hypothetical protein n=1 Tax=Streptomyces sp. NA02950 TaxID=2742137 RepID=UPI001592A656|nr:hypothetical protein [Streptomyces sp. NA02950]QKV93013.1 hypothetical protein HUT19_15650 [Streptomyces sp. NA02950]
MTAKRRRRSQRSTASSSSAPRRTLPSYRANPCQQINILIGLADLDTGAAPVQRAALAEYLGLGAATVGDCMTFLADVGLAEAGRGQYAITGRGRAFAQAWRRDRAQARLVLRPLLGAHWSAAAAAAHLAGGPLPQEELARLLRDGLPGVAMRGQYMVEWLDIALIVERDPQRLEARLRAPDAPAPPQDPGPDPESETPDPKRQQDRAQGQDRAADGEDTGPRNVADSVVLLGMSRREIQDLPDTRYTAFLEGILQTLRGALAPTA